MRRLLAPALLVLAFARPSLGAEAGAGQLFEYGAGARVLGMGGAGTALTHDISALYYNPAGLGLLDTRQVSLMRANLYGGASYDYLGYAQNFSKRPGGWGVQVMRLGISGAERRDATNTAIGSFGYSETALGLAMGVPGTFVPGLSLGAGFKYLQRTLAGSSDKHMGLDLGAQYGPLLGERLNIGLTMNNAVQKTSGDTTDALPMGIRFGAAYRFARPFLLSADVASRGQMRFGAEYAMGWAALRLGYGADGLSFGGGLAIKKALLVDLAVVSNPTFGMSQRLSLGYRFGAAKPKKLAGFAAADVAGAKAALAERRYLQASQALEQALVLDPQLSGEWKVKSRRLKKLIVAMDLESQPDDQVALVSGEPAAWAYRSVMSHLDGKDGDAMILAHVAAGEGGGAYMRLLQGMSQVTRQNIAREDIQNPKAFVDDRLKRAVSATHRRRYESAVSACLEALVVQPENALAWTRLGSAYFASGDKVRARECYEKALRFEPGNAKLRQFMDENMK